MRLGGTRPAIPCLPPSPIPRDARNDKTEPDLLFHLRLEPRSLLLEIAHALGTAEGTIKNHVTCILVKLGARDRTRAVLKALESGLL